MFSDHIIQYSGNDYTGTNFISAGTGADIITLDEAVADPRINETFMFNSYIKTNNGKPANIFPRLNKGNNAYTQLKKYKDLTYDGTTTINNHIMLRYADMKYYLELEQLIQAQPYNLLVGMLLVCLHKTNFVNVS